MTKNGFGVAIAVTHSMLDENIRCAWFSLIRSNAIASIAHSTNRQGAFIFAHPGSDERE